MAKLSAGLLPYRIADGHRLELFLVHPGGPYWAKKDRHAWSVAKGEHELDDERSAVAEREFTEEVGVPAPQGGRIDLGQVKQPSGKLVQVWAIEAPQFEVERPVSNEFEIEWPPRSGRVQSFAEIDRAEWMPAAVAREKLVNGQVAFVDRLVEQLSAAGRRVDEGGGGDSGRRGSH